MQAAIEKGLGSGMAAVPALEALARIFKHTPFRDHKLQETIDRIVREAAAAAG